MLDFELPFLSGPVTINDALAETIDANKSGLFYEESPGNLRLVHFDHMLWALSSGHSLLADVPYVEVLDIQTAPVVARETLVRGSKRKFGLRGLGVGGALLFSVSEKHADPYLSLSSGVRCKRPGKPPNESPRDWYHYYPPTDRDAASPNTCTICGYPL